jgi:hypothetical protein
MAIGGMERHDRAMKMPANEEPLPRISRLRVYSTPILNLPTLKCNPRLEPGTRRGGERLVRSLPRTEILRAKRQLAARPLGVGQKRTASGNRIS